jgi:hypothetical protein
MMRHFELFRPVPRAFRNDVTHADNFDKACFVKLGRYAPETLPQPIKPTRTLSRLTDGTTAVGAPSEMRLVPARAAVPKAVCWMNARRLRSLDSFISAFG